MPSRTLCVRYPRPLLLLPLLFAPLQLAGQPAAAPGDQIAHVTNRTPQNVNVFLVQGGRSISLGRVNANETRAFRLAVPPSATDALLTASPTGDRSLKLVSEPLPVTGQPLTWEIIQMPTGDMGRGVSTVHQRSPRPVG